MVEIVLVAVAARPRWVSTPRGTLTTEYQNFKDNVDNLIDHQGAPFRGGGFPGHGGYDEGQDDDNGKTPAAPQTPGTSTTTSSLTL